MLSQAEFIQLAGTQTIGSHGHTHQPLTKVVDPATEVSTALNSLLAHLKGNGATNGSNAYINSMSFPHGSYNPTVIEACRAAGYEFLFSSDAVLNRTNEQKPDELIFGRIAISELEITDEQRRFHPFMLAFSLFLRPINAIRYARAAL